MATQAAENKSNICCFRCRTHVPTQSRSPQGEPHRRKADGANTSNADSQNAASYSGSEGAEIFDAFMMAALLGTAPRNLTRSAGSSRSACL